LLVLVGSMSGASRKTPNFGKATAMRKRTVFDSLTSLEALDLRLSPSSLSAGASLAPPVFSHHISTLDDPLPDPEPSPGTSPGSGPTPTSGPIGPGTS
jgi:hypothetical protein